MTVWAWFLRDSLAFKRGLVLELAVVHQLADRGPGHGRNLDQVEICLLGQPERIINGNDPDLLAVGPTSRTSGTRMRSLIRGSVLM